MTVAKYFSYISCTNNSRHALSTRPEAETPLLTTSSCVPEGKILPVRSARVNLGSPQTDHNLFVNAHFTPSQPANRKSL